MFRRGSGSVRPASVGLVVACLVVAGLLGASIAGSAAPRATKKVIVKNGPGSPVPVSSKAPALRSGGFDVFAGSFATVPAGVVLTDLVVWSMPASCPVTLEPGAGEGIELAPVSDADGERAAELHLETGMPSTAEAPLTLRVPGGPTCNSVSAFWSGYER